MVAAVGRDQLAALGLVRVLPVVKPLFQGLRDGFALADFVLLVVGRGRRQPPFDMTNGGCGQPPLFLLWDILSRSKISAKGLVEIRVRFLLKSQAICYTLYVNGLICKLLKFLLDY